MRTTTERVIGTLIRSLLVAGCVCCVHAGGGCRSVGTEGSSGPSVVEPPVGGISLLPDASEKVMVGDWDDVPVAVRYGLGQLGMASLREGIDEDGSMVWYLRTAGDEPGIVKVWQDGQKVEGFSRIFMRVTIGRFGDADREKRLLRATARRLKQLKGVEVAPT